MAERKNISKKIRFEVFKRDMFTCQYCGKSSPDVILEVDHINPVAEGGTNDLTNLITSCRDCNRGKGARKLDDDSAVNKQRRQLELLQERREQIEMMQEWQLGLLNLDEDAIDSIENIIAAITGCGLSENGRDDIRMFIKKFGYATTAEAARRAFTHYRHNTDDEWEYAFSKIGGICFYAKNKRCSQCVHRDEYNKIDQVIFCVLHGEQDNTRAESCKDYASMFGDG